MKSELINSEKISFEAEPLDFEVLPEYVRESKGRARETAEIVAPRGASQRYQEETERLQEQPLAENAKLENGKGRSTKGELLEALWPGVHHEVGYTVKRTPSFYLMAGFMGGAVISLAGAWIFTVISPMVAGIGKSTGEATVTQKESKSTPGAGQSGDLMVPLVSVYEVQSGDTLAGIAYRNYKRCSPRLLDAICQANKLGSANVLSLGQKLILPDYRPSQAASKIAAADSPPVQ